MKYMMGFLLLMLPLCCRGGQIKDEGLMPISQAELIKRIQKTPLSSPEHPTLISRAYMSQLQLSAYEQYTLIWRKHQNDANANYLRGIAAEDYWLWAGRPGAQGPKLSLAELNHYPSIIRTSLAKSVELAPNNARAKMSYGYFLWQYDNQMTDGLTLMNQAIKQNPSLPTIHTLLAEVYLNPSTKSYNVNSAEKEARTALQLDPSYARSHLILVRLYINKKQPENAQKELRAYLDLAPPELEQASWIKSYQTMIEYTLKNKAY